MSDTLQEHFGYLSDRNRLDRFRDAIALTIQPGDVVADLGCGFGVLGLFCLEAGAARVWGIDSTRAIDIARETMARAGFADRYHCIRDYTFRAELPEQVDVIICDHVGYLGIDYGIIAMVADARRRMLKPGGRVIPASLDLFLAGVSSPACREKLDVWQGAAMPQAYGWLRSYETNTKHPVFIEAADLRTSPAQLGQIDLAADQPPHLSFNGVLEVMADGTLDGLAGWFEASLTGSVGMTNSPLAADRIARHQAFLGFDCPLEVVAGDRVEASLSIRHEDNVLAWSARVERTGQRARQSTWNSLILGENDHHSNQSKVITPSREAQVRRTVLELIDGRRTGAQITEGVLDRHRGLFPSDEELTRIAQSEIARSLTR